MGATTVELRIEGGGPDTSETEIWLGIGAAVLALAVAATIARRRTRHAEIEPARRLPRVLQPSLLFSGAITFWLVGSELPAPPAMGPLPLVAGLALLVLALIGMVLFAILDFWLRLARPRRTWGWLYLAMTAFAAEVGAAVAAATIADGAAEEIVHPFNLTILAIAAACGAVWWAYLPPTRPDTVRVFE